MLGFDKTAQSIDDPASPWVVVNKSRGLNPLNYTPADDPRAGVVVAHNPCLSGGALEIFLDPQLAAPRVVIAGVPIRNPLVTFGGRGSL